MKRLGETRIGRRRLLLGAGAALLPLPMWAESSFGSRNETPYVCDDRLVSASGKDSQHYGLTTLGDAESTTTFTGFRGHQVVAHPHLADHYFYFARRPGTECLLVDAPATRVVATLKARTNHHFFGHGSIDAERRLIYTAEANFVTGTGLIGVWELDSLKQVAQWPSHGIGPHQLGLLPGGDQLVVANSGLLTHPDSGREALNLDDMRSTLSYLDTRDGSLREELTVAEPKASLRHLDIAEDGTVVVSAQVQRDACGHNNLVPLAAIHKPGQTLQSLPIPSALLHQLQDYTGSVVINNRERTVAVSSPKGNQVLFWDLDTQQLRKYHSFFDVCGIAVSHDERCFALTNSNGDIRFLDARTLHELAGLRQHLAGVAFDNHLLMQARVL